MSRWILLENYNSIYSTPPRAVEGESLGAGEVVSDGVDPIG